MDDFENPLRGSPELSQPRLRSYGCAVFSVGSATWGWALLDPVLGDRWPEGTVLLDINMPEMVPKPASLGVWSMISADLEPPPRFLRIGV
jgi:hypothetical protein